MKHIKCALIKTLNRDDSLASASSHQHIKFNPSTDIATISWSSFIACRQCKYSIIEAIGLSFLQSIRLQLRPGHVLYLSGCFGNNSTFILSGNHSQSLPSPASNYMSNSAEADMRTWRHATQTIESPRRANYTAKVSPPKFPPLFPNKIVSNL